MKKQAPINKTNEELQHQLDEQNRQLEELRLQLSEANDTIEAIRTGQVDALLVEGEHGHQLYTLKSADQTYRVFIEKMTEGAVTLNGDGLVLYANSQFAQMVQRPLSSVIGLPFTDFIAPENMLQYNSLFDRCWKADGKSEVALLAGETKMPVQLSLTTLELEGGLALSVILTDLTAQKATEEQLKQNNEQLAEANKALEASNHDLQQFASVASHDLQEPLRKIQIFSALIKEKKEELTPDTERYLGKIIDSSTRMKTLIIDILNYSRLSASDTTLECIDLGDVANELKEDFELLIQEKKTQLVIGKLPCIEVNKGQMRQVFHNLISNALKFSKPDTSPVISISAKRVKSRSFDSEEQKDGPFCLISVRDNGIGFDEKYVAKIFALFERLNSKNKYEGTGIGMAIAKKIIDKHNGLITASGKEGQGAEFKLLLPIRQPHA